MKKEEQLLDKTPIFQDKIRDEVALSLPFVSIIIPTFNCSQSLPLTLESIIEQDYPRFEVIAIDAGSSDRTLEILQSYGDKVRFSFVETYNLYKMLNKGIAIAQGEYINCLFPGDFYIHHHTLLDIMKLAMYQGRPHLVYCGTLLRDGKSEVKFLFRQLSLDLLRKGQQPTSLQGCWFKTETFEKIGQFPTNYHLRGAFDLLCRFCLHPKLHFASLHRALTDYDLRWVTSRMVIRHFCETFKTIYRYFGLLTTLKWFRKQKDFKRFTKLWLRRLKMAFLGR
jgi:glycosyltransferase involved in cell wall biosynthesis